MVASCGRGRSDHGTRGMSRNGKGGRGKLICSHCGKEGHLQNRCYDLIGWLDKIANISSSDIPSNGRTGPWIIDSGASDHISGNDSVFSSISFISLANGSKMVSQGVGQVSLSSSISLDSVLYIPKCPYNLISLSQLTDRNTGQLLIGEGHESRGLYYLSNNPSTLCFAFISPKLLHNRLGHPSLAKLKLMVPKLNKLSTLDCESCQLGKHVRFTFPNQVNKRCNFPFSIVHSDIWGLS
ncbi:hypothetical protein CR513_38435, partial [Mucuna pruriens]